MEQYKTVENIIEALSLHQDAASIGVLERLGTNSPDEEIRRLTAKALVNKNVSEALSLVILKKGKGINDMNSGVVMGTINELMALEDKTEALNILSDAAENHKEKEIRENASAVKVLMTFS